VAEGSLVSVRLVGAEMPQRFVDLVYLRGRGLNEWAKRFVQTLRATLSGGQVTVDQRAASGTR